MTTGIAQLYLLSSCWVFLLNFALRKEQIIFIVTIAVTIIPLSITPLQAFLNFSHFFFFMQPNNSNELLLYYHHCSDYQKFSSSLKRILGDDMLPTISIQSLSFFNAQGCKVFFHTNIYLPFVAQSLCHPNYLYPLLSLFNA